MFSSTLVYDRGLYVSNNSFLVSHHYHPILRCYFGFIYIYIHYTSIYSGVVRRFILMWKSSQLMPPPNNRIFSSRLIRMPMGKLVPKKLGRTLRRKVKPCPTNYLARKIPTVMVISRGTNFRDRKVRIPWATNYRIRIVCWNGRELMN